MSQQIPEPSGPPAHPSSSRDPGPEPGSVGEFWGARPPYSPLDAGERQQPTLQQPDDQQRPWLSGGSAQSGRAPLDHRPAAGPLSPGEEELWALLAHLSIPFLGFVGPLVVHLVFRDRSVWLAEDVLEALNFSILYTIAVAACSVLAVVLIGAVLLPLVFIGALVLAVVAAVAANRHELYRYPVNWRLVR